MSPSVAVVILNWNGSKHLETYLPSVVKYSENATVYMADNASIDGSILFTEKNFPTVKIIRNNSNGGFAKGYNEALKQLKEDYFVLLNSDVEVTPNWIKPVIDKLQHTENVCIAQPKIKAYLNKEEFEYAGAAGGFIDFLGYPFCQGRIFDTLEKDTAQYDESREIFWATGACMFVKSSIFNQLGGFDERYFAHMEEIDLCWRAKNLGYSVYYVAESTVFHLGGGTMKNTNPRKTFLNFRNSLLTLYKNDNTPYRKLKLLLRLFLDGMAFVKLFISSGPRHAFAIVQAHFSFYKMTKIRSAVENPNTSGILKSSIVWSYYGKGVKYFSQLK
ncbi:MAG: glycosyltransferase family 2 protein [Vicingaceae bacterium]|mgnify:CR=1 FL=1|jgi:GT2 family glycosyltransferase|tara:strand:+ start:856 stop:1848 length:993 start_codon:yes stop_codon:yes gene_type:complete